MQVACGLEHRGYGQKMKAFECKMCGQCCQGTGISVDRDEVKRISEFLNIDEVEFIKRYCIKKQNRYELKIADSNYCVFLKEKNGDKICSIHPVKPKMCRIWPFIPAIISDEDEWDTIRDFCPGMNPGSCFEEFVEQAKKSIK